MGREFDYVIVGAGLGRPCAGQPPVRRPPCFGLLLEAGGPAQLFIGPVIAIPMASKVFNWGYYSAPSLISIIANRCARGRGLGGSSAINGMVYVRGHARDFDE